MKSSYRAGKAKGLLFSIILLIVLVIPLSTMPVHAGAVLTVSNLNDSGAGSLRELIGIAASGDTINFQEDLNGTIILSSQLYIDKNLNITGLGSDIITISGNNQSRIFKINLPYNVNVTISNLTIEKEVACYEGPVSYP